MGNPFSTFGRRLWRWLVGLVAVLVAVTALTVVVSQTEWFHEWLRRYLVREAGDFINGQLEIKKLEGNFLGGVGFADVSIVQEGRIVIQIRRLTVGYNAWNLITRGLWIDSLQIDQPVIHASKTAEGWSLARLIKTSDSSGTQKPLTIGRVQVHDGSIVIDEYKTDPSLDLPDRLDRLEADLSVRSAPAHSSFDIANLSFQGSAPDLRLEHLAAKVAMNDDDIDLSGVSIRTAESELAGNVTIQQYDSKPEVRARLKSDGLSLPELSRVLRSLDGIELRPAVQLNVDGPSEQLRTQLHVDAPQGLVDAAVVVNLASAEQTVNGQAKIERLNLAPLLRDPSQVSDLDADVTLDLRSSSWAELDRLAGSIAVSGRGRAAGYVARQITLKAVLANGRAKVDGQASAYNADVRVAGNVRLPLADRPLTFDLSGRTRHVNLRDLPGAGVPKATTNLNVNFHARGSQALPMASPKGRQIDADLRFGDSVIPGARIAANSTAHVSVRGTALAYGADANVADLNLKTIGRTFNVPAIATERYETNIAGHLIVDGHGTDVDTLNVAAKGVIRDAAIFGGHVSDLTFDSTLANNRAEVRAAGVVNGIDLATASGRPDVDGRITGHVDLEGAIDHVSSGIGLDNVAASVRATIEPTTINGLAIDHANVDADYAQRQAEIRTIDIAGRDLNLTASGSLALDTAHQSNLSFKGNVQQLEALSAFIGPDIKGMVSVEGTVTGNADELQAHGTLHADQFSYHENGALSSQSTFDAKIPNLTPADASVQAKTAATFVTLGGQEFNQVEGQFGYERRQVTFDATARQPQRSLDAAGSLAIVPEYQEVRLDRLVLATANQRWTVAEGTHPTIRYGGNAVQIDDLTLVNGAQQITAAGAIGTDEAVAAGTLNVTFQDIDLAALDALLLREPQFGGTLNGTAVVAGSTDAPSVKAAVEVANGGFRQYKYEGLTAKVEYGSEGISLDARMQQDATQWITAKGHVPVALFTAAPPDAPAPGAHIVPPTPADQLDLAIDTSTLGLGFIQGLTTEVTEVQGTLEAHVRVNGSARDPHAEGTIAFQNGALMLPSTGVRYQSIGGRLEFLPDRVHITQITVLDNHDSSLSITGDVAVHATEIGAVQLWVNAADFKVLDNEAGNVRIQSDLEISGELRSPRVDGDISVTTGKVDLDQIIAAAGTSPYSTKQTEFVTALEPAPTETTAPRTPFEALRAHLRITAPDDFVLRARDLRAPGAVIGFGALNLTLGGDLTATKEPGQPIQVTGAVNTVRGTYDFQGRRFEILRDGSVRFDGVDYLDPTLDIRTRREIQGVEALVTVQGTLSQPKLVLASNPPLEEADILALIVFNQPVNQLGEGEQINLAARAQALALGAGAGQLAQSIGNALNLDTFEIEFAPENGASPVVTIGQQLGKDLYVKLEQGVGEITSTNVVLEYAISQWLRLQTNVSENESTQQSMFRRQRGSGVDLMFRLDK